MLRGDDLSGQPRAVKAEPGHAMAGRIDTGQWLSLLSQILRQSRLGGSTLHGPFAMYQPGPGVLNKEMFCVMEDQKGFLFVRHK